MFHEHILIREFKYALQNIPNDNYKIVMHADKVPIGEHERLYNLPGANEVAIIIDGEAANRRDIVLHRQDNNLQRVSELHRFYDALQYPIIFWQGQEGCTLNTPKINPVSHRPIVNKKVSAMQFYAHLFMLGRIMQILYVICVN